MADSQALQIAVAAYQACHFNGMPECNVNLAHGIANQLAGQLMVFSNNMLKALNYTNQAEDIDREKIKEMYEKDGKLTFNISMIENYARCPFLPIMKPLFFISSSTISSSSGAGDLSA